MRAGRTLLHAALLGLLVAGTVYGVVMLGGYVMMVGGVLLGHMPTQGVTAREVVFGVLMVVLWSGVIVAGLWALARQLRRSVELARWVEAAAVPRSARLAAAVGRAGISGRVVEVRSDRPYAFTYGVWHPCAVVSSALVQQSEDAELVAVLRHEASHIRHRDPLKVLALRTWSAAFAFVPVVSSLFQGVLDRQELRADRAAVHLSGVAPVAGALLKAVGTPEPGTRTALAAMGGPGLLEARIAQLETGRVPALFDSARPAMLPSLPGVALVGVYGVLLYQVCLSVRLCCASSSLM